MKYTIYKLNKELGGNRWWRNYDTNHRNLPDIDIETYLTNKGYSWVELKNTRNEKIGYQTLSKDSYDTIQLYINDFKEIPEYIKIEFEISSDKKESLYYYIDVPPMIYNSRDKLAAEAIYTLDKSVPFYTFHKYLVEKNPQMFYVQKHYDRTLKEGNYYYFDVNKQPWYQENNEEKKLLITESKDFYLSDLTTLWLAQQSNSTYGTFSTTNISEYLSQKKIILTKGENVYDTFSTTNDVNGILSDDLFTGSVKTIEYIVTKPINKDDGKTNNLYVDKYFYWPIAKNKINISGKVLGNDNYINYLFDNLPKIFTDDNIIGKFVEHIPVSTFIVDSRDLKDIGGTKYIYANNSLSYEVGTHGESDYKNFLCIVSDGLPKNINISDTQFSKDLKQWSNNANQGNVLKTKENNPHLLAPQNKQLVLASTTNDKITLGSDSVDMLTTKIQNKWDIQYGCLFSTSTFSRIKPLFPNVNSKQFSQTGNELTVSNYSQTPIQCTAWNNTWLQRQTLDTSRNATIASSATSLTLGTISTILGIALAATGYGTPIGIGAIAGGIGGLIKGGVSLGNGLAQNTQQQRNLYNQPNTLNNPIGISGLNKKDWRDYLSLYTMSLSEQDATIINNEDNMYGYKVNKWLPYSDYLTCWDGNYMLCDMTKNYNSIFNILKGMNSIWTKSDTYINQFIEALNNGITWFTDGDYVDLATDLFNFEKGREGSITRPASVTELIKYGRYYSYNVTASYFNVKDLNLDHYSIKSITGYTDATLSVENNEVVCTVKRTRAVACNIEVEVAYKLWTSKYWTVTSTDTFAWVSEPTGTYSIRIALPYYTKTCKVTVIHNGEKDLDTSHYAVLGGTKYIGKEFRAEDGEVWLYAATQAKDAYENIKIQYVSDGKDWLTSTKQLVLRGSL